MSGIRAEWRLSELLLGESDDPFDTVILSSGLDVDLTGSEEEVFAGLRSTVRIESRLFNRGITCELKDGGQDCLTCSVCVADQPEEPLAPLCRLGLDQRLIENRCNEMSRERTEAPLIELASWAEDFAEMGHLEPEYVDLLAAAGPY